eukprot:TRINITY_DN8374_c0_g1_i1.p1 TRINITY_DN8374_c0_g1~~TRINITY_DN8374_c0_g1_i1.p1  ORF type:complete len:590 (-),score=92.26 TRINITY_DN8374_c0_g1_i1:893-2662(-)
MAMESTESSSSSSKQKNDEILQFAQLGSTVHEGFWKAFADLKLDSLRISEEPIPLTGFYAPASHGQVSNHLKLLSESIHISSEGEGAFSGNRNLCPVPGVLYNTNTLESFKAIDRNALFKKEVTKIWDDIRSGTAEKDCSLLCRFLLISYADLKKWDFYYWFAFPALVMDPPALVTCIRPASEVFNKVEGSALLEACKVWRQSASTTEAFFLVHFMSNADVRVRPLRDWNVCCQKGGETLLGFYDPCHLPSNPGWPLRNFLSFASVWWGLKKVRVLCYREKSGFGALNNCLVADLQLPHQAGWSEAERIPPAVGWERNEHGKMTPRYVKLSTHMDPVKLAVSAADLNLKLMRWRSAPSLDLQRLASTKCLLLGAGTLGCQVARGLMAWGIRNITFVDAGRVSMSNPLRQSLYGYEDCLNGGQLKATSAAKSLQAIFPGVEATGVNMTIPMPCHCVSEEELSQLKANCMQLKELVANHDVVFLLTDTRESRWLPTLLCAEANKVAITAAIGFGSFLVMRHGAGIVTTNSKGASGNITVGNSDSMDLREATEPSRDLKGKRERLSCYFCSDIVAPKDVLLFIVRLFLSLYI